MIVTVLVVDVTYDARTAEGAAALGLETARPELPRSGLGEPSS